MTNFPYPEWLTADRKARLESEDTKLITCVEHAETAIYSRLQAIAGDPDHYYERQALSKATSALRNLQAKRLKFPK